VFDKYFGKSFANPKVTNKQLKLLWLGAGKEDFLYKPAIAFMDF